MDLTNMAPFDKQVLAYDDLTPKPVLAQLALDQDPAVRSQVAKNPNTPPPALATLAKDKDRHIIFSLSQNPSTPPATLLYLASDENWAVRQTVSCNICAPAKALQKLAFDQDAGVREAVIQNPNTPPSLLTAMYYDMVQKDALSEWLAIAFIRKNFLPQTELCALVALFGQRVAEVIADNIAVAKGSALEKTLLLRGFKINKRPRIKERNKLH